VTLLAQSFLSFINIAQQFSSDIIADVAGYTQNPANTTCEVIKGVGCGGPYIRQPTIIAQDPERLSQAVTVDVGSKGGVRKGMSVLGQRGLVGKVVAVQANSAQVRLITDPLLPVNVELASNHLQGTLRVTNDRMTVQILGAPTDLKLGPGEVLVTSGLGGNFPKGLPLAELVSFKYQPYGVTQSAEVTPLDSLAHLEYLMVDTDFVAQGDR